MCNHSTHSAERRIYFHYTEQTDPRNRKRPEGRICARHATAHAFGDFWFRELSDDANYEVTISAKGFQDKVFDDISTVQDVNLGEIALVK